ncbi:MAG: TlpA disulfide reductase family protein [Isosphaeraceae bacterium]
MQAVVMSLLAFAAAPGPSQDTPRSRYEALVKEFDAAQQAAFEALKAATNDQDRLKAAYARPQPHEFAPRFFDIAERNPEDPVALDALFWVASRCVFGPPAEKALAMIARDHGRSERIQDFCGQCSRYGEPFPPYEEMLRVVLKDSPHRAVKGAACLALADYLKMAQETTESRLVKIAMHGEQSLDPAKLANVRRMQARGLEAVAAESEALFRKVIDEYADVRVEGNFPPEAAELAKGELHVLRDLGIGREAPDIVGKDIRGRAMRLADSRGKVVVLEFGSHRSCGVCRQMYPYLRAMVDRYREKPFALLGISVEDDVQELVSLADKGENTWPILWDGENLEGPLASQWMIRSMPTFYVLDAKGVIRNKGFIQPNEIEATVDMLLKEMERPRP